MSRQYCQKCMKASSVCICQWLRMQQNQTPVIILQHPDEARKPLGTAGLVKAGLARAAVLSDVTLSKERCFDCLKRFNVSRPILLYAHKLKFSPFHLELDFEKEFTISSDLSKRFDSVILLDGTWRNTRELLHVNSWLHHLPVVGLKNVAESRYRIRKAEQDNALATIEAVSSLLSLLDEKFDSHAFLQPFEKMIDLQISKMGKSTYHRNYLK